MTDVFKIIVKYRRKIIAKYRHLSSNGNRALDRSSRSQMFFKIGVVKAFVNFTGKHLCWSRSSRSQVFFKIVVLKIFVNFTGKHLCWSLFLIKLQFQKF